MIAFLAGVQIVASMALVFGGWLLAVHVGQPTPSTGIAASLVIALGTGWTGIVFASLIRIGWDLGHQDQKERAS